MATPVISGNDVFPTSSSVHPMLKNPLIFTMLSSVRLASITSARLAMAGYFMVAKSQPLLLHIRATVKRHRPTALLSALQLQVRKKLMLSTPRALPPEGKMKVSPARAAISSEPMQPTCETLRVTKSRLIRSSDVRL